ncbi:phosphotransferase enzyme family protein [Kineococcus arenarius]|uniref:phosphotransferase enzyme family protein n=1 Tax=unclassified Kineococcus TaxID=2621656 RepID=UPI003D7E2DD6
MPISTTDGETRVTTAFTPGNAEALARRALVAYGLPADATLTFVKLRENCVFRVDVPGSAFAMRLHRPGYRSRAEVAAEVEFVRALANEGFPVADVVPDATGVHLFLATHDGLEVVVDLQRWIDTPGGLDSAEAAFGGTSLLGAEDFHQIGELAARMHNASERLAAGRTFERVPWDLDGLLGATPLWGDPRALPALDDEQRRVLDGVIAHLTQVLTCYGAMPGVYGPIHADFTPENLLRTPAGLVVIDFDDCGDGWHLFDLATALFWYLPHPRYPAYREALIRGYRSVRPLDDDALDLLEDFLTARGLTYLGWAATRPETEAAGFIAAEVLPLVLRLARERLAARPAPAAQFVP